MHPLNKSNERELAFLFLYQMLSESNEKLENDIELNFEEFWNGQQKKDNESAKIDLSDRIKLGTFQLINSAINKISQIEETLLLKLNKKDLNYIEKIERALLTLGAYELSFSSSANDSKKSRAHLINSYVDLAKKYGKKNSYGLVNGVLDKL